VGNRRHVDAGVSTIPRERSHIRTYNPS
jgi:hypothetical protein